MYVSSFSFHESNALHCKLALFRRKEQKVKKKEGGFHDLKVKTAEAQLVSRVFFPAVVA